MPPPSALFFNGCVRLSLGDCGVTEHGMTVIRHQLPDAQKGLSAVFMSRTPLALPPEPSLTLILGTARYDHSNNAILIAIVSLFVLPVSIPDPLPGETNGCLSPCFTATGVVTDTNPFPVEWQTGETFAISPLWQVPPQDRIVVTFDTTLMMLEDTTVKVGDTVQIVGNPFDVVLGYLFVRATHFLRSPGAPPM